MQKDLRREEQWPNVDQPELTRCLDRLDEGDTLMVWRLDRLGRSLRDLLEIVNTDQASCVMARIELFLQRDESDLAPLESHWPSLRGN
jgi:hypothetical protein